MSLPKVLIVGPSFCHYLGGGITMSNLFAGWDPDKIAVACIPYFLNQKVNTNICDNYYQLGSEERKAAFPLSLINSKSPSGPVKPSNISASMPPSNSEPGLRHRFVMNVLNPMLEYSGLFHGMFKTGLSEKFKKWLAQYNPDIIYAQAFTYEDVNFCVAVQSYLNKPMAFHMMDDWPSSISTRGPFKNIWQKKIDGAFRQLLDKSALLLVISEDMATEYQRRYGKSFVPFHNPIHVEFWKKDQKTNYELSSSPRVLYAGRVGLGIDSSLQTIAKAIEKINSETNSKIQFVLRAGEKPGWIDEFTCTSFEAYGPYSELPKKLSDADLLALPYDFSQDSINYIKYSIPTKITEYMVSGTPTILFGPEGIALVNYARKHHCFEVVTENSPDILAAAIYKLLGDKSYRENMGRNAALIAETEHDAVVVTKEFRDMLASMTNKSGNQKTIVSQTAMH